MDWDLKNPPWSLPVLENRQPKDKRVGNTVRGLDLKLGASRDLLGSPDKGQGRPFPPVLTPESSSCNNTSLKRVRATSSAIQKAMCLVDGCEADLSDCREYHKRHKVCEMHSKTPTVLVGGTEQRFCQQCSRFHLLVEFDEVKRSCRKRLDGHNRRRRKPPPNPLNSGSLFPAHQAEGLRYSFPHTFTAPTLDPSWTAVANDDESVMNRNKPSFHLFERQHHSPPNSTFQIFKEGKGFPMVRGDKMAICNRANVESSSSNGPTSSSKSCSMIINSNGLPDILNADCALSLLSSPFHSSVIHLGPVAPDEGIPFGQPLAQQVSNQRRYLQPHSPNIVSSSSGLSCSGIEAQQVSNIMAADSSHNANLNCHTLYSLGDSVTIDAHSQALPFSW